MGIAEYYEQPSQLPNINNHFKPSHNNGKEQQDDNEHDPTPALLVNPAEQYRISASTRSSPRSKPMAKPATTLKTKHASEIDTANVTCATYLVIATSR